jgi:hypothetical protein
MKMRIEAWSPQVLHFPSHWKELCTLLATLWHAAKDHKSKVAVSTFFYFTDSIVTYYIVSLGSSQSQELHLLIVEIKKLIN